jgi:hypothetical protein
MAKPPGKMMIRVELCGHFSIEGAAQTAIMLAGRLNNPVVFVFDGVDVLAGTSDTVQDVKRRYAEAKGVS